MYGRLWMYCRGPMVITNGTDYFMWISIRRNDIQKKVRTGLRKLQKQNIW